MYTNAKDVFAKTLAEIESAGLWKHERVIASPQAAHDIVETVAPDELPILKADFYASLCAAFTLEEAKAQLKQSRLPLTVTRVSDRHMLIRGVLP